MKITDAEFAEIERRLNACVHELVFACTHAENDELQDALDNLVTVQGTLHDVANELEAKLKEETKAQPALPGLDHICQECGNGYNPELNGDEHLCGMCKYEVQHRA